MISIDLCTKIHIYFICFYFTEENQQLYIFFNLIGQNQQCQSCPKRFPISVISSQIHS